MFRCRKPWWTRSRSCPRVKMRKVAVLFQPMEFQFSFNSSANGILLCNCFNQWHSGLLSITVLSQQHSFLQFSSTNGIPVNFQCLNQWHSILEFVNQWHSSLLSIPQPMAFFFLNCFNQWHSGLISIPQPRFTICRVPSSDIQLTT